MLDARSEAERELRVLAGSRRHHTFRGLVLARAIRYAVEQARLAGVPMSEIARLLEMDRSSIYRTYT